jgi:tetratricopeptide (TPR) repeat protein
MFNIIALIVILVCLAIILVIVYKKLPLLANFDISSIPEEKAAETKTKIMEERLARKAKFLYAKIVPFFKIIFNFGQRKFKTFQEKIKTWEDKYKTKTPKEVLVTKEEFVTFEKKIENLLKEAQDLVNRELYAEAEKKYLEILNLEPKNTEAYRGLGNIFILQQQYEDAKQTFLHVLKLNKADSFANFEKMENYDEAIINLEQALHLVPNNPKYLDLLITISLIIKDKDLAKKTLQRLKEANPDNAKIEEFQTQIKEL